MGKILHKHVIYFIFSAYLITLADGCSREMVTYDGLEAENKVESRARKEYSNFFKTLT